MTVENLRDVLREHADPLPPPNPSRDEQVRDRVRRTRARRRIAVGAVGTAVVAAVALAVPLLPATPRPETTMTVSGRPMPVLPERFTSADGTGYRLVARTAIEKTGNAKATLKVPYTGKPLDVGGMCVGPDDSPPRIEVEGSRLRIPVSFMNCDRELRLQPLDVPEGATEVTVTFNTVTTGGVAPRGSRAVRASPWRARMARGCWAYTSGHHPHDRSRPNHCETSPRR